MQHENKTASSAGPFYLNYAKKAESQEKGKLEMCCNYAAHIWFGDKELNIEENRPLALAIFEELINKNYIPAILQKLTFLTSAVLWEEDEEKNKIKSLNEAFSTAFRDCNGVIPDCLEVATHFANLGAPRALTFLAFMYQRGDTTSSPDFTIEKDDKLAEYYSLKLKELHRNNPLHCEILSLLEKASELGDADSSRKLAKLYCGEKGEEFGYLNIPVNLEKALSYMQLSLEQGQVINAVELAELYLANGPGQEKTRSIYPADIVSYDLEKAVQILKKGHETRAENEYYYRRECAFKLAQLYIQHDQLSDSQAERAQFILYYFEAAAELGDPNARRVLGALYLVGSSELGIEANVAESDRVFSKSCPTQAMRNACEIAKVGNDSPLHIDRYLKWLFTSIIRKVERPHSKKYLVHLLEKGIALYSTGVEGSLRIEPNPNLAKKWSDFDGTWEELKSLILQTYAHVGLTCPFTYVTQQTYQWSTGNYTPTTFGPNREEGKEAEARREYDKHFK